MRRRAFLASTTAVVAGGCIGLAAPYEEPPSPTAPPDLPRVDEPPYPIDRPDPPENPDEPNTGFDERYLGSAMPTEPSVGFETLDVARTVIDDRPLLDRDESDQYLAILVDSAVDRDAFFDLDGADATDRGKLLGVDLERTAIVAIETGWGSGSVQHVWNRAEPVFDGLHLHGYYTAPYLRTADLTTRFSLLAIERPVSSLERVLVSLTVDEDRRVNFSSTEGVVEVAD